MHIIHRYLDELHDLERNQFFCNQQIDINSNILIVGTFNPSDESCVKKNVSKWFYGRIQNKFWKYFPTALTNESLHPVDRHNKHPQSWQEYCSNNKIIIIDLIKSIEVKETLNDFGDIEVEDKINHDLSNINYFDIDSAFSNIRFKKVIYSLKWSDRKIKKLRILRDVINEKLLNNNCIQNSDQIKYCLTPTRNDAGPSWDVAVNE